MSIILILVSILLSVSFLTLAKFAISQISFLQFIFICYFIGLSITIGVIYLQRHNKPKLFAKEYLGSQLLRGIFGAGQTFFVIISLLFMPMANDIVLRSTYPLWLPILTTIFISNEKTFINWPALITGFIGMIILTNCNLQNFNYGSMYGLLAGVSLALSSIFARKLNNAKENIYKTLFFTFLIPTILLLPFIPHSWQYFNVNEWLLVLLSGILLFFTICFLLSAYKYATPVFLAPFSYLSFKEKGLK